jgi:protoheme IX farnesyltransferase
MKVAAVVAQTPMLFSGRLDDYLHLVRPRIAFLVLFTVGAGGLLAGGSQSGLIAITHAVVGTALVAGGASSLNQWLERDSDARMRRTESRPLPAGRMAPAEALVLGAILSAGGLAYLLVTVRHPAPAALAALALVSYVGLYTPAKRRTTLNTLIGAVPGALPPVIGWTAVTGRLDAPALALFLIVFVWQVPHFLSIAWIYREDYRRAGFRMLSVDDPRGELTGREMVRYCVLLIPVSLWPAVIGLAGLPYMAAAVVLGAVFLQCCVGFARRPNFGAAKRVLRASLFYLPSLFFLLVLSGSR